MGLIILKKAVIRALPENYSVPFIIGIFKTRPC